MKALTRAAFLASLMLSLSACGGGAIPVASSAFAHQADSGGGMTGDRSGRGIRRDDSGGGMTGDDSGGGMTGDFHRGGLGGTIKHLGWRG
jgi:hypothetical protein